MPKPLNPNDQTQANYLGLMSGTSCDGIDAVAVHWPSTAKHPQLLATAFTPYPSAIKAALVELTQTGHARLEALATLEQQLTNLYQEAATEIRQLAQLRCEDIAALGCHGQTIFHQPQGPTPFSWQLCDAQTLAHRTQLKVVSHFRTIDIALGGQGAPLAPALHAALFSAPSAARAVINIGGIANISYLPSHESDAAVLGFDTGPGNGLIDYWVKQHWGLEYDHNGELAREGRVIEALLRQALHEPYFAQKPPKSTGREFFNAAWLSSHLATLSQAPSPSDVLRTLVRLSAQSIADSLRLSAALSPAPEVIYLCGGGAHNALLVEDIQQLLPGSRVTTTAELGLAPDWVEAVLMAWLAREHVSQRTIDLTSITGASRKARLGQLSLPS